MLTPAQLVLCLSKVSDPLAFGRLGDSPVLAEFARAIEALVRAECVPQWISVDERKPEKNIEVLIAFRDVTLPATGQYTASPHDTWGWCFPKENDPEDTGPITHWMPLPAAPIITAQKDQR